MTKRVRFSDAAAAPQGSEPSFEMLCMSPPAVASAFGQGEEAACTSASTPAQQPQPQAPFQPPVPTDNSLHFPRLGDDGSMQPVLQVSGGGVIRDPFSSELSDFPSTTPTPTTALTRRRVGRTGAQIFHPARIENMRLTFFSEEEITRGSVVHVFNCEKGYSDSVPTTHGINDTRMGVVEHGLVCGTCGREANTCPGHFGHVMLPIAVFHPTYLRFSLNILRCVCWCCADLLHPDVEVPDVHTLESKIGPHDIHRLAWLAKRRQPMICPHCRMPQPAYEKSAQTRIIWTWIEKRVAAAGKIPHDVLYEMQQPFTAARARMIFEALDDGVVRHLGIDPAVSHPKNYVVRALPVPPPAIRPSVVKVENSKMRGQDDLTSLLAQLVKRVQGIRLSTFDDRIDAPRMYEFGIPFDRCTSADIKRTCRGDSNASRKEHLKQIRERQAEEKVAIQAGALRDRASVPFLQPPPTPHPDTRRNRPSRWGPPVSKVAEVAAAAPKEIAAAQPSASAFALRLRPDILDRFRFPFEEGAVRSAIALTRPYMTPALARLEAPPDVSACEYLQKQGHKTVTMLELLLMVHLHTDGSDTAIWRLRNGGKRKTLVGRLRNKDGRIRGNLMGKRVFSSGRAVISPCQQLDVDELGVPRAMACVLTYGHVLVSDANIEALRRCVRIGALRVNGANMVVKGRDGTRIFLEYALDRDQIARDLRPGDQVERYIQDGDIIIFNRQPSLHRASMMGHRVRIVDQSTLCFNSAAASPYNADFDGDEMNVHVPKGIRAQAEAWNLMSITKNLISPASNAMTTGIVQDGIVAGYLFTRQQTVLTRSQMCRFMSVIKYPHADKLALPNPEGGRTDDGEPLWTGRQALSLVLPTWLQIQRSGVIIRNGQLVQGALTKAMLGAASNGITHRICVDGSLEMGMRFMSDVQRILHAWFEETGFTTGLHDMILADAVRTRIKFVLSEVLRVADLFGSILDDRVKGATRFVQQDAEQRIRALIAGVVEEATQLGLSYMEHDHHSGGRVTRNGLWDMITSGSKGSKANAFQMVIAVGTQIISGNRIPRDAQSGRTLACFAPATNTAASRGLVRRSYVDGLTPQEFFMHNMGGREGLVHTAIKTAETGYLQRRLVKAMEGLVGMGDGSVRDGELRVVQYAYGGDAMDPSRLERTPAEDFLNVGLPEVAAAEGEQFASLLRRARAELWQVMLPGMKELLLPCDPERVVQHIDIDNLHGGERTTATVRAFERLVFGVSATPLYDRIMSYFSRHLALRVSVLWALRPSRGIAEARARSLVAYIASRWERARMAAGEPCGVVAAQSIGEPSTQMTLNSPHHSGRVGAHVTLGVPRIKEIIDGSKKIHTPITLAPVVADNEETARRVANMVRCVRLEDMLHSSFVALDPARPAPHALTNVDKDGAWMEDCAAVYGWRESDVAGEDCMLSPYVIRFSMRRDQMMEMGIAPVTLARAVERCFGDALRGGTMPWSDERPAIIQFSPRSAKAWVMRVRLMYCADADRDDAQLYQDAQIAHVLLLKRASANQAHQISWATAGRADHVRYDPETQQIETRTRWVVQASGASIASMSRIREIDWNETHTNDIASVFAVLGIEAANALIYEQMMLVMTNDGSYIDPRHAQLLADCITMNGEIMPVRRHGIHRMRTGFSQRASFEETAKVFMVGAAKGDVDDMIAPAGAVMTAQHGAFGSGWVGLLDPRASKYNEIETYVDAMRGTVDTEAEVVAAGGKQIARHVDARTGQLKTRPVAALQRVHDQQGGSHSARANRPIEVQAARHKYTATAAIAASTYGGYAAFDFDKDSRPAVRPVDREMLEVGERPRARGHPASSSAAATDLSQDLTSLQATLINRMGIAHIVRVAERVGVEPRT